MKQVMFFVYKMIHKYFSITNFRVAMWLKSESSLRKIFSMQLGLHSRNSRQQMIFKPGFYLSIILNTPDRIT